MTEKLDYKKEYRDLYLPGGKPVFIAVPKIRFIMVDGSGDPNGEEYGNAVGLLYVLCYTIKMSKMGGNTPDGYFDYVVPPLEGLWDCGCDGFDGEHRENWSWTSIIRQPEFVTQEIFDWACARAAKKKPEYDYKKARLVDYEEGECVQIMHTGPFSTEPESVEKLERFIRDNGLADDCGERRHHEIYMKDPRKCARENMKTVLRHPVRKL
ncbi:MAG TPA: GyrI-like domain-containing protein [Caproiciproducens sp.]|jgi:Uncharacterized conserved protein|nr:GyrI-like domain-containing protein [Caproiciproducens sp.]